MRLKYGVVVLISTQEELNLFAELEEIPEDALHIEQDYVAFRNELGAVEIMPRIETLEGYPLEFLKPTIFRKWWAKNKEKVW
jgi:hypothetical protein